MRKIILMISVSLDGFIEGPDRQIDWHLVDDELHRHFNEQLGEMGAFLDGRVTYELMARYWPTADADPSSAGPVAEFAGIWRDMPKIVFSRTLERAEWNTTIAREVDVETIMALKAQPGGDLALGCGPRRGLPAARSDRRKPALRVPGPHRAGQTAVPGNGRDDRSAACRDQDVRQRRRPAPVPAGRVVPAWMTGPGRRGIRSARRVVACGSGTRRRRSRPRDAWPAIRPVPPAGRDGRPARPAAVPWPAAR